MGAIRVSLINKMLQDLEARDGTAGAQSTNTAHDDLRAVRYAPPRKSYRPLLIVVFIVVALAAGAYHFFDIPSPMQPNVVAQAPTPAPIAPEVAPEPTPLPALPAAPPVEMAKPVPLQKAKSNVSDGAVLKPVELVPVAKPPSQSEAPAPVRRAPVPTPKPTVAAPAPSTIPTKTIGEQTPIEKIGSVEKQDRPVTSQEQAEARYREGAQYMSQGRAEDARTALGAALAQNAAHHQARELLVALAMQSGRLRDAQDLLTQGLKVAPTRLSFALLLARTHLEQGADAQAIAVLESSRLAGAGNADYFSFLATLYQRSGRHTDAVGAYREAIVARPQDARAWLGLGISLEATQDLSGATGAYNRALAIGLDASLAQYAQQRLAAVRK